MDVKGIYLDFVEFGEHRLHVWMNPRTKKIFAIENMEVDVYCNFAIDPYNGDRVIFENTFTGLPK